MAEFMEIGATSNQGSSWFATVVVAVLSGLVGWVLRGRHEDAAWWGKSSRSSSWFTNKKKMCW